MYIHLVTNTWRWFGSFMSLFNHTSFKIYLLRQPEFCRIIRYGININPIWWINELIILYLEQLANHSPASTYPSPWDKTWPLHPLPVPSAMPPTSGVMSLDKHFEPCVWSPVKNGAALHAGSLFQKWLCRLEVGDNAFSSSPPKKHSIYNYPLLMQSRKCIWL